MNRPWTQTYDPSVPLEIDADAHSSAIALFEAAVEKFADNPAFECFGQTMTYAEVDRASRAVAACWIGNASFADIIVIWARDVADNQVKGLVVEKGTRATRPR